MKPVRMHDDKLRGETEYLAQLHVLFANLLPAIPWQSIYALFWRIKRSDVHANSAIRETADVDIRQRPRWRFTFRKNCDGIVVDHESNPNMFISCIFPLVEVDFSLSRQAVDIVVDVLCNNIYCGSHSTACIIFIMRRPTQIETIGIAIINLANICHFINFLYRFDIQMAVRRMTSVCECRHLCWCRHKLHRALATEKQKKGKCVHLRANSLLFTSI